MLIYNFSTHSADGSDREYAGRLPLTDDNAARAFGKAMIRDMMRDDILLRYAGWTMNVAKGTRPVCSIPFPPARISPIAIDNIGSELRSSATKRRIDLRV